MPQKYSRYLIRNETIDTKAVYYGDRVFIGKEQ